MQVNIHEAKSQLSRLIQQCVDGEEVIIARNNHPVVRLQAIKPKSKKRELGSLGTGLQQFSKSYSLG